MTDERLATQEQLETLRAIFDKNRKIDSDEALVELSELTDEED